MWHGVIREGDGRVWHIEGKGCGMRAWRVWHGVIREGGRVWHGRRGEVWHGVIREGRGGCGMEGGRGGCGMGGEGVAWEGRVWHIKGKGH